MKQILLTLLACGTAVGAETNGFGFRPLEIFKFDDGIARLESCDLDDDGQDDLVFLNNRDSRIEILFAQKPDGNKEPGHLPELEERFLNAGMIADQHVRDHKEADLNGDGLLDLITVGAEQGLNIRFLQPGRKFSEPKRIFTENPESVSVLQAGDLDGDKRTDLLLLYRDRTVVLWNDTDNDFRERSTIGFARENATYAELINADDDPETDLLIYFNEARTPLSIFKGRTGRKFSAEYPLLLPAATFIHSFEAGSGPARIGTVLRNRSGYRLYSIRQTDRPDPRKTDQITVRRIALENSDTARIAPWCAGDFDQDGYDDLISAAPQLSQLHLYSGTPDGLEPQPRRIDTLSDVTTLEKLDDGRLLVISRAEKSAALHDATLSEAFPKPVRTRGEVLAGTAGPHDTLYLVCKEKEQLLLNVHARNKRPLNIKLELKNEPARMLAFDLNEKETGLLFFIPYEKPQMLILSGKKTETVDSTRFPALNRELKPEHFLFDTDGNGGTITVAAGRTARIYEWNGHEFTVGRQINPEQEQAELKAVAAIGEAVLLYNERGATLLFSEPGKELHRLQLTNPSPAVGALTALNLAGREVPVLISPTALNEIGSGTGCTLVPGNEYTTEADQPVLQYAVPVTAGTGRDMIAVIDSANSTVELLENTDEGLLERRTIKVFETPQLADKSKGRAVEPHAVRSGDFNGDGIADLALLCHDRLIIYPGE